LPRSVLKVNSVGSNSSSPQPFISAFASSSTISATPEPFSRANQIADAVAAQERRDAAPTTQGSAPRDLVAGRTLAGSAGDASLALLAASSQQRHAISPRRSPGAARRDDKR
jgi:hypothetical protein